MKLYEYEGKKVEIRLKEGETIKGKCLDFTKAINNDPEEDSIDIELDGKVYEIYESEIEKINLL